MRAYKTIAILGLISLAAYWAIASGEQPGAGGSPVPNLKFESFEGDSVFNLQDGLVLNISYFDADGDLGQNDPDVHNLFVTDKRNEVTYKFRIQQLRDDKYTCGVEGNMEVVIPKPSIIDPNAETETLNYSIYAFDRAGNKSNVINTGPIKIYR